MTATADFAEYVRELLAATGHVAARKMFGGYGLYLDGVMFALIAHDVLYLKADERNRPALERAGSMPFTYEAKGRRTTLAYWRAPDEAMESRDLMAPWARGALDAALRAKATRPQRPAKERSTPRPRTLGSRARSKR